MENDMHTFLIPRPFWVNDLDQTHCHSCNNAFGPLRRRHHCRQCGNIFCHDCSSRSIPLPQLGYGTRPVRVCNQCLEVAYLVTYIIDEDHGSTTQIHGARGLLEVVERDNDQDLAKLVQNGGVDALIWLCRSQRDSELHFFATSALAILSEKESIRPVIITKSALRPLIQLMALYLSKPMPLDSKEADKVSSPIIREDVRLEVLLNCSHVIFQLGRAAMLTSQEIRSDGAFITLLQLADFHYTPLTDDTENNEKPIDMQALLDREQMIQSVAAKGISAICATVSNQPAIFEVINNPDQLTSLLESNNSLVTKYIAKAIAYLSLRNDKYKSQLLQGKGAKILVQKLKVTAADQDTNNVADKASSDETNSDQTSNLEMSMVANLCCAIANFATNGESQQRLMTQPQLLQNLCATAAHYSSNTEIHRHIARCFANFALYDTNRKSMLHQTNKKKNVTYNVIPTLLAIGQSAIVTPDVQRHVVRAIDNLSNQDITEQHRSTFAESLPLLKSWMKDNPDADLVKRAETICCRFE
ncbi:armadillo-type protein [Umbelopsis sp. AD052]|nr:armadillo-type protein [Umbelopsis sp. AD052]